MGTASEQMVVAGLGTHHAQQLIGSTGSPRADRRVLLQRAEPAPVVPVLDADQQRVVDHPDGPLLVLAGPGTGKTTTIAESVVERIEGRGVVAEAIIVLTFSRRAAAQLRDRIIARLGRTAKIPTVLTFHGFCYALLQRFGDEELYGSQLRLLTAPEQEFRVRETLAGSEGSPRTSWPASVEQAFPTRGFAAEVRAVLAKARQLGMDPEDLIAAGAAVDRPEWVSVGRFFDEYLDVLDAEQVLDYAELVHRCRILLADPGVRATVHNEIDWVFVDEYQDTDPAQVGLLQALAGGGRNVVVVGDPDQSIYAFRGAHARGILDFPEQFRTLRGTPAPMVALAQGRRFGPNLQRATRRLATKLSIPRPLPADVRQAFRFADSVVDRPSDQSGSGRPAPVDRVDVFSCVSSGAEAEHIAHLLRTAHLHDGVPWSQMAVLVRSGRRTIPGLSRALIAAGVPVEVAGDEIPLGQELAVRPLLLGLQAVLDGRVIDPAEARQLLMSGLAGLDGMGVRRLGRALREAERLELGGAALARSSDDLMARALRDPAMLDECAQTIEVAKARQLAELLIAAERLVAKGATASETLWQLWSGTSWPQRLRSEALGGGDAGRRAHRDVDAVCALFDIAARSSDLIGARAVSALLAEVESQQIPADTRREADLHRPAVRLLTAHRAKGLEWELVVVASVQEGLWPDLRRRGTLLEPDRLSRHGLAEPEPTSQRIAEERRLFYVACTRARHRLVVTAVEGIEGEADQPSRFITELGVPVRRLPGRPARPLSLPSLIGELRSVSVDPGAPPRLREAAAIRLARLAEARDGAGRPIAPAADPAHWWGLNQVSRSLQPVVKPEEAVRLSGSQLAAILACPRSWFLSKKANGEAGRKAAASFGSVIHVLAEHAAGRPADPAALSDQLESVWERLDFDAEWLSAAERVEAEAALERFTIWQEARIDRELLGAEVRFETTLQIGAEQIYLTGTADRVERDIDGRIQIIDFKTSRSQPAAGEVALQDQLGVYQLAVQAGAFEEITGPDARPGGAELVYLRLADGTTGFPKVFGQPSLEDVPHPVSDSGEAQGRLTRDHPTWVHARLAEAAEIIRTERFEARIGPACRYCPFVTSCPAQARGQGVVA